MSMNARALPREPFCSTAGYAGGAVIALSPLVMWLVAANSGISVLLKNQLAVLLTILVATCLAMLGWEFFTRMRYYGGRWFEEDQTPFCSSTPTMLRSALWRYIALLTPWLAFTAVVYASDFYSNEHFVVVRTFCSYLLSIMVVLGLPYILLTLKYCGTRKHDYNDYAILLMVTSRGLFRLCGGRRCWYLVGNRRVRKIVLTYLISFLFLSIMLAATDIHVEAILTTLRSFTAPGFGQMDFFFQYRTIFLFLLHLLFLVDTGNAVIAYTLASRWLENRTKSVDLSIGGWLAAMVCYPPLIFVVNNFIGYETMPTTPVVTSDWGYVVVKSLALMLYVIYVWADLALGLKFSQLSNRGIVHIGPYRYFRHPAYASKNVAWWLDHNFVFSNVWAAISLFIWNMIYVWRGLTEERHLKKDSAYRSYCQVTKNSFIPSRPRGRLAASSELKGTQR